MLYGGMVSSEQQKDLDRWRWKEEQMQQQIHSKHG